MDRGRKSISITELLVVIAIVAILALVLFPAFGQARGLNAQQTCLTNARNIGAATLLYAQDYDETMPPAMQTAPTVAADICGFPPDGGVIIETLYDALFPYVATTQVFQCPTSPQAVDLCSDSTLLLGATAGSLDGIDFGTILPDGNVRYASYVYNFELFGVGGAVVSGVDLTEFIHEADGLPYPAPLAAIVYPADTPTVYDGYLVGTAPLTVAIPRHGQAASVAYVDGHSAPFGMAEQANYEVDEYTGLPVNQYYIASGPYQANPGAQPNSAFNGIVTDPVCETEALPRSQCLTDTATPVGTPTFISDVTATVGSQSADITWNTSVPASGVILYGTTTQLGSSTSGTGMATSNSVTLTGLQSGTLYHYRVQATNASGNVVVGGDQTFVTSKPLTGIHPTGPKL